MRTRNQAPHRPQPAGQKFRQAAGHGPIGAIELLSAAGADCPDDQQRQALADGLIDDVATIIAARLLRRKGRRTEADEILKRG